MRYLRFCAGLLLIPCNIALTFTVIASVGASAISAPASGARPFLLVAAGAAAAVLMFWALPVPWRLYVLGHELTHALWGALLGARIYGIKVAGKSGHVKLSKSNWFIALSPYFFPLYTFVVILAYYCLLVFVDLRPYSLIWLGLIGLTMGFHFLFTLHALAQDQQDVRAYGRLFSLNTIYLMNMLGICLLLLIVAPISLQDLIRRMADDQAATWSFCGRTLMTAANQMQNAK